MVKSCTECNAPYEVTEDDLAFYDRVSPILGGVKWAVPPPKRCPRCRQLRRLAWRNEQQLFRRQCDLCQRSIISSHPGETPYPVFCVSCWWSDRWNPFDYGIELDLRQPFMEQFRSLQALVPQLAIQNDNGITSENSEYCYDISRAKNCYRVVGSWYIEECYYSLNVNRSKFLVDCNTVSLDSELGYESLDSQRIYHCAYLQNCEGCSDCYFGYDLKGCKDCIACFGLRQQRFQIYNTQYSEPDYRAKLQSLDFGSLAATERMRTEFDEWLLKKPRRAANQQSCEESVGNNLFNCKGVLGYSVFNSEYSKFLDRTDGIKNSYDLINTGGAQWCYDCVTPDDSYLVLFSVWCWKSKYVLYSDNCHSSEHLCGCISMHRAKHCILNKQYSPGEYEIRVGEIIRLLQATGEWGEHLPVAISPFRYNETGANEYYPMTAGDVAARGWRWAEEPPGASGKETVSWASVPDSIKDLDDSILGQVLACIDCQRNYKIIPKELSFYRSMPVPLPRRCPLCRHLRRFQRKTPTQIWGRQCQKCLQELQSAYSPEGPEVILCDECYFGEVY